MSAKNLKAYKEREDQYLASNNLSSSEEYIKVEPANLKVRVQSIGSGKPLLFIHGSVNAGSTWADLVANFPDRRCLILDRPGCALSDDIKYKNYDSDDLDQLIYNTINSVLSHYQLDKVDFIGSSFGGYWTVKFANRHPEKVGKIVLEGCPAMVEEMNVPGFMKTMVNPIMSKIIPLLPTTKGFAKKTMKDMGHNHSVDNDIFNDAMYDWYVALLNKTRTMPNEIANLKLLFHKGEMKPEYVLRNKLFANLQSPVLMLWGQADTFGGKAVAENIASIVENGELKTYPRQGHLPWLDDIETHAKEIRMFLDR